MLRMLPDTPAPVDSLLIEHEAEPPLRIQRKDDAWTVRSPMETPAKGNAVESLLLELKNLTKEDEVLPAAEAEERLSSFGLDRPRPSIVVKGVGFEHRISLGDTSPFDGRIYARRDDGPVVLIHEQSRSNLDRRAFNLREKRLLRHPRNSISSFGVRMPDSSYLLERRESAWSVTSPHPADSQPTLHDRADRTEVNKTLTALENLGATRFPASSTELDLERAATIEVELEGAKRLELELAKSMDGDVLRYYVLGSDLADVVEVRADAVRGLRQEPGNLRYRNVLEFVRSEVRRVEIDTGEKVLAVRQPPGREGHWRLAEPEPADIESWRVTNMLRTLSNLKAEEIVEEDIGDPDTILAEYDLLKPSTLVRLLDEAENELEILAIGGEAGPGRRYATNAKRRRVFTVLESRLANLPKTSSDLGAGTQSSP